MSVTQKYAKVVDTQSGLVCVGLGDDSEQYAAMGMEIFEVEQAQNGSWYLAGRCPQSTLADVQVAKRVEINAGFDAAITASLTMPSASTPASAFAVYQAIEAWKAEDPEGYSTLLSIHEARRASLLAAVDAATTFEAVQAIEVSYAV